MALKISRILHAGYVFECNGTTIAFDTIFENPFGRNGHAFPKMEFDRDQISDLRFDAVFISHYHDDHCSLESLNLLDKSTPIYLFCVFEELFDWIKELGFTQVIPLVLNKPIQVGGFEITPRRALDEDVDSLFQIRAAGLNILNVVDSWIDYETLDLLKNEGPWNMILWPFQTMRELEVLAPSRSAASDQELPPEWLEQLKILNPQIVVPSSCQFEMEEWSWYNKAFFPISYKKFASEIAEILPHTQVVKLNPGTSVVLGLGQCTSAAPLSWIRPLGDQEIDYVYDPYLVPPQTSEIARNFPALSQERQAEVLGYCEKGLLEKFRSLEFVDEGFFVKPRHWRLSLFDHEGKPLHFDYRIHKTKIEMIAPQEQVEWITEVPLVRLYGALKEGEALTSMYIRVNDTTFDPLTELELQEADVMEDPLIRCLFTGIFGELQRRQLEKIKAGMA